MSEEGSASGAESGKPKTTKVSKSEVEIADQRYIVGLAYETREGSLKEAARIVAERYGLATKGDD